MFTPGPITAAPALAVVNSARSRPTRMTQLRTRTITPTQGGVTCWCSTHSHTQSLETRRNDGSGSPESLHIYSQPDGPSGVAQPSPGGRPHVRDMCQDMASSVDTTWAVYVREPCPGQWLRRSTSHCRHSSISSTSIAELALSEQTEVSFLCFLFRRLMR